MNFSFARCFLGWSFLLGCVALCMADTVKDAALTVALDSPKGIQFSSCTNASVIATYSNGNIDGKVVPVWGKNFLQMNGSEANSKKIARSERIKSAFSFQVAGANIINFCYRAATYGANDDSLIFYEDDIDDTLFDMGGDYWAKVETLDGEKWYGLDASEFFYEGSVELPTTSYFHTIHVAVLAPSGEDYYAPDSDEKKTYDFAYKVWLDDFTVEDADNIVCDFYPESGSTFGGNGLVVNLQSDYMTMDNEQALTYYYTLDGSEPTAKSKLYDDATGILVQGDEKVVVRVAAYENGTLIGNDYQAEYVPRNPPSIPFCNVTLPDVDTGAVAVLFGAYTSASTLDFYYTLDGSMPTKGSACGWSVEIAEPCTLRVLASDEGKLGPVATFQIKRLEKPETICEADGLQTDRLVFDSSASVEVKNGVMNGEIQYHVSGGVWRKYVKALSVTSSSNLFFRSFPLEEIEKAEEGSLTVLPSEEVCSEFLKTKKLTDGSWIEGQLKADGWNLVKIDKNISVSHARALAGWLLPYGFNEKTSSYEMVTEVLPARAYWVYGAPSSDQKPTVFTGLDLEQGEPLTRKWQLRSGNASSYFDNNMYRMAKTLLVDVPGWAKQQK